MDSGKNNTPASEDYASINTPRPVLPGDPGLVNLALLALLTKRFMHQKAS